MLSEDKYIDVYIDGACINNGRENAKCGMGVYWKHNNLLNKSQLLVDEYPKTNNRAELNAAIIALNQACTEGINFLRIHTDSEYVFKTATQWINLWKNNDWKKSDGSTLANIHDIKLIDQLSQKLNTHWVLVKGHSGIYGNECADKLAKASINQNILKNPELKRLNTRKKIQNIMLTATEMMHLVYLDKSKTSWIKIIQLSPPDGLTLDEFEELWKIKPTEKLKINLGGKLQDCPRYTKVYLKPYYFSGLAHHIDANMPDRILRLLDNYAKKLNPDLNQSLVNWYDSDGCIGKHSDDTRQLKVNSEIFSFSFGPAVRTLVLEPKIKDENIVYKIRLEHNTLVIMGGRCQETHLHSVPRSRTVKTHSSNQPILEQHHPPLTSHPGDQRRLNITFRCFK